jgi:hypothetical protein
MAIYGAGSNWDGDEMKDEFFQQDKFEIGWNYESARDLYHAISGLKVGDIVYLKSNQSGSRSIRVKGIGVVTGTLADCLITKGVMEQTAEEPMRKYVKVWWIVKDEFHIHIPETEGKLTNVRAATFYEEYLPYVQKAIINRLFPIES